MVLPRFDIEYNTEHELTSYCTKLRWSKYRSENRKEKKANVDEEIPQIFFATSEVARKHF